MHRIVHLERDSVQAPVRRPAFAHRWTEYAATRPEDVEGRLQDCSIAIINKAPLTADLLARLPALEMIAVAATGCNSVDLDFCRARGIAVANIPGYARQTLPEHVFALILALARNLIAYRQSVQAGCWQESSQFCAIAHPIRDLHGATLGLVGSGSLGLGVARLAEAFGMRVLRAERKGALALRPGYVAFSEVLAAADVLTLHCPLTPATQGLIGRDELRAMKPSALLINTARGALVDEAALITALREGWIAGAGLDVISTEPPPVDHPMLAADLLARPNFLLTPHVAWASRPAMEALAEQLIDNIEAFVRGEARNRVL